MKYPDAVIMVVDDDPDVGHFLARALEKIATVFTFTNPVEALAFATSGVMVSVALVDQCMPVMEGTELLGVLQKKSPTTYRILMSGFCEKRISTAAYASRLAHHYLAKPWSLDEARAVVSMAINSFERTQERK